MFFKQNPYNAVEIDVKYNSSKEEWRAFLIVMGEISMEITIEVPDQLGQQLENMPDFKQFVVNALQRAIQERPQKTKKLNGLKKVI